MPAAESSAIVSLGVFVLTGLLITAVTETLRKTMDRLSRAKTYSEVLLQELAHRTRNDLTTIMSMLRLQARTDSNPAVRAGHCFRGRSDSPQAASIGLIVNELVTNAFKYAFPAGRTGTVEVEVVGNENQVVIAVRDDGVGCPAEARSGLGTRLINLLMAQMKGHMARAPSAKGCQAIVTLTVDR